MEGFGCSLRLCLSDRQTDGPHSGHYRRRDSEKKVGLGARGVLRCGFVWRSLFLYPWLNCGCFSIAYQYNQAVLLFLRRRPQLASFILEFLNAAKRFDFSLEKIAPYGGFQVCGRFAVLSKRKQKQNYSRIVVSANPGTRIRPRCPERFLCPCSWARFFSRRKFVSKGTSWSLFSVSSARSCRVSILWDPEQKEP